VLQLHLHSHLLSIYLTNIKKNTLGSRLVM